MQSGDFLNVLTTVGTAGDDGSHSEALSHQEALAYMQAHDDMVIVDVRSPEQFQNKHFRGALNIPASEIKERAAELPQNARVLLYCNSGRTALRAYDLLKPLRPDLDLAHVVGGPPPIDEYNAWKK